MSTPRASRSPRLVLLWAGMAAVLLVGPGCEQDKPEEPESKTDLVTRIDAVHYNPAAKEYSKGPCEALFTMNGRICGQRGKASVLSDDDRKLVLKLLKDRQSYRGPTDKRCWAPRHAFILMDKDNEQIGYFDLSLPCGKVRSGDRKGALQTDKRELFEDLTPEARQTFADILKRSGLPVDEYLALEVPRGSDVPVQIAPIIVTVPDAPKGGKPH